MTGPQLTVAIFFWGSAVVIGLDALKAQGWRQKVLWGLTGLFTLAGFLVQSLWDRFPDVSAALVALVGSPVSWLILAAVGYVAIRRAGPTHGAPTLAFTPETKERLAGLEERLNRLEDVTAIVPSPPSEPAITLTSHKGKPLVKLPPPELERVSSSLLAIRDYLTTDFADFLSPFQELRNAEWIIKSEGGGSFHRRVEAPRPTMREFIDGLATAMKPYEDEILLLNLNVMGIKTKALPLWDALKHLSDVTQVLPEGPTSPEPVKLPLSQFGTKLGELEEEHHRVLDDIKRWRLKISRGELG